MTRPDDAPAGREETTGDKTVVRPRVIRLDDAHNLRDLGGLPSADGRVTARGRLFRSEFLASPATLDDAAFRRLGLRSVVDLRRHGEVNHEQAAWDRHGIVVHHVPLRLSRGTSWDAGYERYLLGGDPPCGTRPAAPGRGSARQPRWPASSAGLTTAGAALRAGCSLTGWMRPF